MSPGFPWTLIYWPVVDTPCAKRARRILVVLLVLLACPVSKNRHAMAQVLLTQDEALALAFPSATSFDRTTAFLGKEQAEQIEQLAGTPPDRLTITHYIAMQGNDRIGVGYFDAHLVRTLNEVLLVAIGLEDEIITIEVVAFAEPPEYRAPDRWLELFDGKSWEDDLSMKGEIPNLTGATLSTRAVKSTVERILALHRVLNPLEEFIR
jgi:electron transport complex protein RnfG